METRSEKAARIEPRVRRFLVLPRRRHREKIDGAAVYAVGSEGDAKGLVPVERIDESTRQVFAAVAEEYDELCDRLFAGDPVLSYGSDGDRELQ